MRRKKLCSRSGVITVFFTLLIAVFLGLFFALAESVRIQGARAAAANITAMSNYSLFSEYEKQLLTDYELFGLDCAYGGNGFSTDQVEEHLKKYLKWNERPLEGITGILFFDPWQIRLSQSMITEYSLLSDPGGCGFYDQAVSFMKETALAQAAGKLHAYYADAQKMEDLQKTYEEARAASDSAMEGAESGAEAAIAQAREEGIRLERPRGIVNPLREIAKVVRQGIFESVIGDADISGNSVSGFSLASHRLLHTGTLKLEKETGGLTDDLLFREYLLDHFPNFADHSPDGTERSAGLLQYQAEYLAAGKNSDVQNLKSVVLKLALLREGANYLYCIQDLGMNAETEGLALLLMGWTGIPQLVEVVKQALLVGWTCAESLIDVRTLLLGGRVPLMKDASTWYCSLDQLKDLSSILREPGKDRGTGLRYKDYLRILLNMQPVSQQIRRGMDLVEINMRSANGFQGFRIDHCIVAVRDRAKWSMEPVFTRVTRAFTGIAPQLWETQTQAGFAYR